MKTRLHPRRHWLNPATALALVLGLGLLWLNGGGARAATLTVTSAADGGAGSLRATIAAAAGGDTINFAPALNGQTIVLTNAQLVINKSLNILGPGPGLLTIFADGDGDITGIDWGIRVIKIASNSTPHTVTIAGLTIAGGSPESEVVGDVHGGGGIFNDGAFLTVSNCVFRNNTSFITQGDTLPSGKAGGSGGGAICNRMGVLTVLNCTLTNNLKINVLGYFGPNGGAIYNQRGMALISDSVISHNRAGLGSGPSGYGGGLFNDGTMVVNNCILVGNRANGSLSDLDPNSEDARGPGQGGAIWSGEELDSAARPSLTVTGCTILNNSAAEGGGIASWRSSVTVSFSRLSGNVARLPDPSWVHFQSSSGGAISAFLSDLNVNNCTLSSNTADLYGGGIRFFGDRRTLNVHNSTLVGNAVTASGTTPELARSIGGGAMSISQLSTARVDNCTITGNSAFSGGGISFRADDSTLTLNNSIVAGNTTGGVGPDILTFADASDATLISNGHNFIGTTNGMSNLPPVFTDMTLANTGTTLGQLLATDAQGRPLLANQGGPTPTVALPVGSRAIDAGANSSALMFAYDQRGPGFPRIDNLTVDIGAFEFTHAPEMAVQVNGVSIADGDTTPGTTDGTDFGNVSVSSGTLVRTFTITNLGNASLSLTGAPLVVVSGTHAGNFTVTALPVSPVPANGTTTFQITFNPSATGLRTATLSIPNDDPDENPYNFAIQGTGVDPEINVTGNGVSIPDGDTTPGAADGTDFGSVAVSSGTVVRSFTVTNLGTAPLVLSGVPTVAVSGPSAVDFTVNAQPASPVAANGASIFQVTFNPSLTGPRTAILSITNNDPTGGESVYTFALLGTGTGPCLSPITVLNTNDNGAGSLRQALVDICAGGTIDFAPALNGQTIRLTTGGLVIDRDVSILGPGATNLAISGGGLSLQRLFTINSGATGVLAGLTIADGGEGGLQNSGTLTLSNCAVSGHSAVGDGGGVLNSGNLTVVGTTIHGNITEGDAGGGGLYNSGVVTLENSTISGNSAPGPGIGPTGFGGGLYNFSGSMTLRHCTVAGNAANVRGDGLYLRGGTLTASHTLLSNAGENYATNSTGNSVSNGGFNLASDSSAAAFATNAGNLLLGALAHNGGPTRTHALLPGSPAIGAGNNAGIANLTFDQRGPGFGRLSGARMDIGAFEVQVPPTFTRIQSLPAGVILNVLGAPYERLEIQWRSAVDAGPWILLTNRLTGITGRLNQLDATTAGQTQRFYRVVRP